MTEIWIHQFAVAGKTADAARTLEELGFDGMLLADSQDITADIWVELTLAARATDRLKLGPGVTNLVTRHPTVTASAAATLQDESGGRVVLGIGRGDSALSKIGLAPEPIGEFRGRLRQVQELLAGRAATLENGAEPTLPWLAGSAEPPVPVFVGATGPKVIAAVAEMVPMINFTVGAEPGRLEWAIGHARDAAGENRLSLGVFIDIAVDPDPDRAREMVRGSTATLARFGLHSSSTEGMSDETKKGIAKLAAEYEEARHGEAASTAAQDLSDGFIDRFAVCGTAEHVTARLRELIGLGLDRIVLVPGSLDSDPGATERSNRLFAEEVLPAIRS